MKSATTILLKRKLLDRGQSQHENHLHSKTRLLDYHESATNVANSAFYSNRVTASRPIATSKLYCIGIVFSFSRQYKTLYIHRYINKRTNVGQGHRKTRRLSCQGVPKNCVKYYNQ